MLLGSRLMDVSSREELAIHEISSMMNTVRRTSEGKYAELLNLFAQARIPVRPNRLRSSSLPVLNVARTILIGFITDALRDKTVDLPSRTRNYLDISGIDGGVTTAITDPFRIEAADGNTLDAFATISTANGLTVGAFKATELGGTTTNVVNLQATDTTSPVVTLLSSRTALVRSTRGTAENIFRVTVDSSQDVQSASVTSSAITAVGTVITGLRSDYTDSNYVWCQTRNATSIRVHKINLDTGTEEGYAEVSGCDTSLPAALVANGDDVVLVAQASSAGDTHAVFLSIADGSGVTAPVAVTTGTQLQIGGSVEVDELGVFAPIMSEGSTIVDGLRLFASPVGTNSPHPVQAFDIFPALGGIGIVQNAVQGLNNIADDFVAVSGSGEHILVADPTGSGFGCLYNVRERRQVATFEITGVINAILSPYTVTPDDHMLLMTGASGAEIIAEVSVK